MCKKIRHQRLFFESHFPDTRSTQGHSWGDSRIYPMLFNTKKWFVRKVLKLFFRIGPIGCLGNQKFVEIRRKRSCSHSVNIIRYSSFHSLEWICSYNCNVRQKDCPRKWMYELPHEMPNTLRLKKVVNFKKITEMLGFDGEYPVEHPKGRFWHLH